MNLASLAPLVPALMLLAAAAPVAAQTPQKVDASKSSIRFVSKQMGVPVEGRFRKFDATVAFDPVKPEATKADFEVELASIDLGSEEGETEVKRPLWFDTARFPKAKFTLSSLKPNGPGKYEATGALSIKGITLPVSSPVTVAEAAGSRTVDGQFPLKRLAYKIGEGHWSDTETVADEVLVRFRFVIPSR
jgi:polyisoprenoid-binding protein YceI